MTENQRETFRLEPEDFEARLSWQGRDEPCDLVNLSAGGARVRSTLQPPQGASCRLQLRLANELQGASAPPFEAFEMEVLEATDGELRLRSRQPDAAASLVFTAQRVQRARETGAGQASPMRSDPARREQQRPDREPKFSKRRLRPDAD